MKSTTFIAILHNGPGEPIAYLNTFNDTGDEIVHFLEQAEHFDSYSAAMNAVCNTDTRGWAYAEIAAPMVLTFVDPPIPTGFEWVATYAGDEPDDEGCQPSGCGPTQQAAIENLLNTHPYGRA